MHQRQLMSNEVIDWVITGRGEMPPLFQDLPKVPMPDTVLIVDRKTGCHFFGDSLIHTEKCMCDKDDQ